MKFCFIVNSKAGKGKNVDATVEAINAAAKKLGADCEIFMSESENGTREHIAKLVSEYDGELEFVACGGDGTLCRTILSVMDLPASERARVSVGVVPMGTGNDFASNFEDKKTFFDIEAQLDPTPYKIDLIKCNDVYSVNMINVGFDSHVVCQKEKIGRKKWVPKKFSYIFSLVITLVKKPWLRVDVSYDGGEKEHKELLLTTMANGAFCGGGFNSNPLASLVDGQIDFLTVKNVGRVKFLTLVGKYKSGTHLVPKFSHIVGNRKCRTADLYFDRETPVSVDGEIINYTELHLSVEKGAIKFMLPAGVRPCARAVESGELQRA